MSDFFKTFLACFLAIVFFVFVVIFLGILSATIFSSGSSKETSVPAQGVLKIRSSMSISATKGPSFSGYGLADIASPLSLTEMLARVKKATRDSKVKAILIEADNGSMGMAFQNELIDALHDFKSAGKKVYAYATYMGQRAYYLSTVADKIVVHPRGMLTLQGLSAQVTFYKGLMDKLGVEPEIIYAGRFKSATEPYRLYKMSEENRKQTTVLIDNFWELLLDRISTTRKISTAELTEIINNAQATYPEEALKLGLIDAMAYEDKFYEDMGKDLGWSQNVDPEEKIIAITDYEAPESKSDAPIALVDMEGLIRPGQLNSEISDITDTEYLPLLNEIKSNDAIKAVVLHINSGGGDAVVSDKIWHAVTLLSAEKPVVCYISEYAASGGYYIAAAAPIIVAQPHSITGSIGVFRLGFNAEKLFSDKLGITFDQVNKGELAGYGSITKPMNEKEKQLTQDFVDRVYLDFKKVVARGRDLNLDAVEELASGRVYTGRDAMQLGLVDSIGYLSDALRMAAKKAGLNKMDFREYPLRTADPMQLFLEEFATKIMNRPRMDKDLLEWSENIQKLKTMNGRVQMLMPYEIKIQ